MRLTSVVPAVALMSLAAHVQGQEVPSVAPIAMAKEVLAASSDAESHVRHAVSRLQIGFEKQFKTSPRYLDFDRAYPGAITQLRAAIQAEAAEIVRDETPRFNDPAAVLLASQMSADDLRALRDFNRTPLGRRMADASRVAAVERLAQVTADDGAFDVADASAVQGAGVVGAAGVIREIDAAEVLRFAATPAASRYVQLRPAMERVIGDSELAVIKRAGPRFAAAFKRVIDRRVSSK